MKKLLVIVGLYLFTNIAFTDISNLTEWIDKIKQVKPDIAFVMESYSYVMKAKCGVDMDVDSMKFVVKYDKLFQSMLVFKTEHQEEKFKRSFQFIYCPMQS